MPLAGVVTIIGAILIVLALAFYLIRVALILRDVSNKLAAVNEGLGQISEKTEPVGPILGEINRDVTDVNSALQSVLQKERTPRSRAGAHASGAQSSGGQASTEPQSWASAPWAVAARKESEEEQ